MKGFLQDYTVLFTDLISGLLCAVSYYMVRYYSENHLHERNQMHSNVNTVALYSLLTNGSGRRPSILSLVVKTFSEKAISYSMRLLFRASIDYKGR